MIDIILVGLLVGVILVGVIVGAVSPSWLACYLWFFDMRYWSFWAWVGFVVLVVASALIVYRWPTDEDRAVADE